jgi:hypothetical protein
MPAYTVVAAILLEASTKGDDHLHAAIQKYNILEDWIWVLPPLGWDFN